MDQAQPAAPPVAPAPAADVPDPTPDPSHRLLRDGGRAVRLSFILGVLVAGSFVVSFAVDQFTITHYARSIAENQEWTRRVTAYVKMRELAGDIAQAGDEALRTHDAQDRRAALAAAQAAWEAWLQECRADLSRSNTLPQEQAYLHTHLEEIAHAEQAMLTQTQAVLQAVADHDTAAAVAATTRAAEGLRQVNLTITGLTTDVRTLQNKYLDQRLAQIRYLQQYGLPLGVLMFVLVGLVLYFMRRLALKMVRAQQQQVRVEESLRQSEERLRLRLAAIEAAQDMVIITDRQGVIEYVNPAFTRITGYSTAQALGHKPALLKSDRHEPEFYARLWQTILQGRVWSGEIINRRRGGELYVAEMSITPVRDEQGRIVRFVALARDVTERKKLVDALRDSQRRMALVMAQMPAIIWTTDANLTINSPMQSGVNELLEYADMTVGRCLTAGFAGGIEAFDFLYAHTQALEGRTGRCERRINDRIFDVRVEPLRNPQGQIIGCLGMAIDSTERRRMEESVRQAQEQYRTLLEHLPVGVYRNAPDDCGRMLAANPAMAKIFGFDSPAQFLDQCIRDFYADPAERPLFVERLCRDKTVREVELRMRRRDGQHIWVRVSAQAHCDPQGRVLWFDGITEDITQRRRAEAAERQKNSLQEAVLAMEQVLGVVGHELRTPLAALRVISELMLSEEMLAEQRDVFLQNMHDELVRMAGMVNNVLEAARLNSGLAQWNWGVVDLSAVLTEALRTLTPLAPPGVQLQGGCRPQNLLMQGDAEALRRLIINLVNNAQKHTPAGQISVTVEALDDPPGPRVRLCVSDTGAGIAPDILEKLGVAFALNSGVVGEGHIRGTGLGLAICKGIAAAHGGNISFASTVGRGTTVTVTLRADLDGPVVSSVRTAMSHTQGAGL